MATRWPFRTWHYWKSIDFCLCPQTTCIWNLKMKFQSKLELAYTQVICHWRLYFIVEAKQKLESENRKIQYGHQAAILKATSLKINRDSAHAHKQHAYEILIMKCQSNLELGSGNQVACRRMDRQIDRQTHNVNPVYPKLRWTGGINNSISHNLSGFPPGLGKRICIEQRKLQKHHFAINK